MKDSLSIDELRGKQSVRTTFKLPQQLIDVLGVAASQFGIKQKSLLDQLIEEVDTVEMKSRCDAVGLKDAEARPKTFVLSRNALNAINRIARQQKMSRDTVAEYSIIQLLPLMNEERKKHLVRKRINDEFHKLFDQGLSLLEETGRHLGENDLLYEILDRQIEATKKHLDAMDKMVEKGSPLEEW